MKNILVAIDLDQNDQVLLEKAIQFAKPFNSKVWLMHIAAPEPDFVGYEGASQYLRDHRAGELRKEHKLIQKHADYLEEQGVDSDGLLIQGATVEMIMEESKKLNIEMIIIGHHDRSFLYKAILGSVSAQVIKRTNIPVLIIPIN